MTNVLRLPGFQFQFPRRSPIVAFIVLLHAAFLWSISVVKMPQPHPPRESIIRVEPAKDPVQRPVPELPRRTIGDTFVRPDNEPWNPIVIDESPPDPGPIDMSPINEHGSVTPVPPRVLPRQDPRHPIGKPDYPSASIRLREEGVATLTACVAPDGQIADVSLKQSSGHTRLDGAALRHLRRSGMRMLPGTENAVPVRMCADLTMRFELTN